MKNSTLYPRLRATAAALALALVAAGCAVGPDYQKPQSAPVTLASPSRRCSPTASCSATGGSSCRIRSWTG